MNLVFLLKYDSISKHGMHVRSVSSNGVLLCWNSEDELNISNSGTTLIEVVNPTICVNKLLKSFRSICYAEHSSNLLCIGVMHRNVFLSIGNKKVVHYHCQPKPQH